MRKTSSASSEQVPPTAHDQTNEGEEFDVFIVYQSHEVRLAELLKELFAAWKLRAFFCREPNRAAADRFPFRADLAQKIRSSKVVVCLVSKEFEWSNYCQSEAGYAFISEKPILIIAIPPLKTTNYYSACAILEGTDVLSPLDNRFEHETKECLFRLLRTPQPSDESSTEKYLWEQIRCEFVRIIEAYEIKPSKRVSSYWKSIDQSTRRARVSIKHAIKESLRSFQEFEGDLYPSTLTFVGVSLKYSLTLITEALGEFAEEIKLDPWKKAVPDKVLRIQLVHMDDFSHSLIALDDYVDIKSIQLLFNDKWKDIEKEWLRLAQDINVTLEPPVVRRIDFIPSRVGILVDHRKLYEGSCSYQRAALEKAGSTLRKYFDADVEMALQSQYRLLVGELEYAHFERDFSESEMDLLAKARIDSFISMFEVYRSGTHNGFVLASDGEQWTELLKSSLEHYPEEDNLLLISDSGAKFEAIIKLAAKLGKTITLYVRRPEPQDVAARVHRVGSWMRGQPGHLDLHFYDCAPTFRAAAHGEVLVGVQSYANIGDQVQPTDLRVVITRYCPHYAAMRELVTSFIVELPAASQQPVHRW